MIAITRRVLIAMTQKSVFEFKLMRSMPGVVIDICRHKAGSPRSRNQVFATDKKVDKAGKVSGNGRLDNKVDSGNIE